MQRLPRRAVLRHLDRLADDLTPRQLSRLRALAELIGDDGRIRCRGRWTRRRSATTTPRRRTRSASSGPRSTTRRTERASTYGW
jgi:hypothetical protein